MNDFKFIVKLFYNPINDFKNYFTDIKNPSQG